MDAQGRGRADNIDPADQWVLNPNTGEYELRLTPSAPQSAVPGPRRAASRAGAAAGAPGAARARTAAPAEPESPQDAAERVPGPRRRRGVPEEPAGRRGRRPVEKKSKT